MTYQGERARPVADEVHRIFEVSAVRLDPLGWPTEVLWAEISAKSNLDVYAPVMVPVADVVDALQDEAQVVTVSQPRVSHVPPRHLIVFERAGKADSITHAPLAGDTAGRNALPDLRGVAILQPEVTAVAAKVYQTPRRYRELDKRHPCRAGRRREDHPCALGSGGYQEKRLGRTGGHRTRCRSGGFAAQGRSGFRAISFGTRAFAGPSIHHCGL